MMRDSVELDIMKNGGMRRELVIEHRCLVPHRREECVTSMASQPAARLLLRFILSSHPVFNSLLLFGQQE